MCNMMTVNELHRRYHEATVRSSPFSLFPTHSPTHLPTLFYCVSFFSIQSTHPPTHPPTHSLLLGHYLLYHVSRLHCRDESLPREASVVPHDLPPVHEIRHGRVRLPSPTHPPTYSSIHSSINLFIHPLTHPPKQTNRYVSEDEAGERLAQTVYDPKHPPTHPPTLPLYTAM